MKYYCFSSGSSKPPMFCNLPKLHQTFFYEIQAETFGRVLSSGKSCTYEYVTLLQSLAQNFELRTSPPLLTFIKEGIDFLRFGNKGGDQIFF